MLKLIFDVFLGEGRMFIALNSRRRSIYHSTIYCDRLTWLLMET